MTAVAAQYREEATRQAEDCVDLECESQLRIAAVMLVHSREVTATTVVGALRPDQQAQFDALVADTALAYGLDATLHVDDSGFAVRFFLPTEEAEEPARSFDAPAWLRRLLAGLRSAA